MFTEEMLLSECLLGSAKFASVLKSHVLVLFSVLVEASGVEAIYAGSSIPAEFFVGLDNYLSLFGFRFSSAFGGETYQQQAA